MCTQREIRTGNSIYGKQGAQTGKVKLPYSMRLAWNTPTRINSFTCHHLIADRLEEVFKETLSYYGECQVRSLGLDLFGGCYADRKTRRGTSPSIHAWGLAVDLDPLRNKLRWKSDKANFARQVFIPFWDIVKANGFISLGQERGYDWMHFQEGTL